MLQLRRFRPRAFELLAFSACVATWAALRLAGFDLRASALLFTLRTNGLLLAAVIATGVVLNVLYRLPAPGGARAYLREVRTVPWLLDTARIWLGCVLLIHAYTWLKALIPFVNGRRWDVELTWFDQTFHLGISPNRFLVALFEGTPVLPFIDWTYFLWLPFVLALLGFFAAFPGRRTRAQFLFSHVGTWVLGLWIYVAMPALGPALAFPDDWRATRAALPLNSGGQGALIQNYRIVLEARKTGELRPGFNPALGVAAMPSLHVGIDWLLLLWCLRRARRLAGFLLAVVAVHFLGSIVTGWHYAVDAYVGIAIAQLAYLVATRTERDLPDDEPDGLPAPSVPAPSP